MTPRESATPLEVRLTSLLGEKAVGRDGVVTVRTGDDVVSVCTVCKETGTPLRISSSAGEPYPGGVSLSLRNLDELRVDRARSVAYAGAGVPLQQLREAVAAEGLTVAAPLPAGDAAHVGGVVARGDVARRALTGIAAVLPTGERVATPGWVHKDVASYDLAGMLLGSLGRLAVITGVYFRLVPQGMSLDTAEPPGSMAAGLHHELLRQAFDPDGLLTPASR